MKYIDGFLNSITMYRLVLYGLIIMVVSSILLGFMGFLPFSGFQLIISSLTLIAICYLSNVILSNLYKVPRNTESSLITALIIYFVMIPSANISGITILLLASLLAMISKYILAIRGKHLFNPAAISVFILGVLGVTSSAWWVATPILSPFVIIIGLLVVRKLRRFSMFLSFIVAALISIALSGYLTSGPFVNRLIELAISWPLIYFGAFMLTEPLTTPPTRKLQMLYGTLVGLLFGWRFQIGPLYSTPELALIIGNIFSYALCSKQILKLRLRKKIEVAEDVYEFSFTPNHKLHFSPGQYLEWTLPYRHPDSRGNRRYFTIASSPTEDEIKLGVKVSQQNSSAFKKNLLAMNERDKIFASQLSGDFILPSDKKTKLVFIAGGIGITPFRSMAKYLLDKNDKRNIILFYAASSPNAFAYKSLFEKSKSVGIKPFYLSTRLSPDLIKKEVPDYMERIFYLSGPDAMVTSYKKMLLNLGVGHTNIKTDYFPGY